MSTNDLRKFINLVESIQTAPVEYHCCGSSRDPVRENLDEQALMEFEEFMQANGGKVLDLGAAHMVIVNGPVTGYIQGGTFSIPGLKINGVDILSTSQAKDLIKSTQVASSPVKQAPAGIDMTPSANRSSNSSKPTLGTGSVNRTGGSVIKDYDDVSDAATVTERGKIDVVYNVSVPASLKNKIQDAVNFTAAVFQKHGLSWVSNTTVYVNCLHNEPTPVAGRHWYHRDYTELTDADTGHIKHTLVHEFGHRFNHQCNNSSQLISTIQSAYDGYMRSGAKVFPTQYSKKDSYEWFAESWTYWLFNQFSGYIHAEWFVNLIKNHNR